MGGLDRNGGNFSELQNIRHLTNNTIDLPRDVNRTHV